METGSTLYRVRVVVLLTTYCVNEIQRTTDQNYCTHGADYKEWHEPSDFVHSSAPIRKGIPFSMNRKSPSRITTNLKKTTCWPQGPRFPRMNLKITKNKNSITRIITGWLNIKLMICEEIVGNHVLLRCCFPFIFSSIWLISLLTC